MNLPLFFAYITGGYISLLYTVGVDLCDPNHVTIANGMLGVSGGIGFACGGALIGRFD